MKALQAIYPEHNWAKYDRWKFGHSTDQRGSKSQSLLLQNIQKLLPGIPTVSNYRLPLEENDKYQLEGNSGLRYYELDVSYC
jgi:hypothetical protein